MKMLWHGASWLPASLSPTIELARNLTPFKHLRLLVSAGVPALEDGEFQRNYNNSSVREVFLYAGQRAKPNNCSRISEPKCFLLGWGMWGWEKSAQEAI